MNINQLQIKHQTPYDLGLGLASTFIFIFMLYLSYSTFANYKHKFMQLRHGDWTLSTFTINKDVELQIDQLTTGIKYFNVYIENKKIYQQNCRYGLNYLCTHFHKGNIQPQSLSFYHLKDHHILNAETVLLGQIQFLDQSQQLQKFDYTKTRPNDTKYIKAQKTTLKRFYLFTLICYVIFGYFAYSCHVMRCSQNEVLIELTNATILTVLSSCYFYFVISYFFF